ncbi:MAG TPA: AI-2E family transporter [Polyangiaceae bacterium]|nr:AI-2E family transporter [Polyangiaceae bacterium]
MTDPDNKQPPRVAILTPWLDLALRLGLLIGLLTWSLYIVRPFLAPMIWGTILAVTLFPLYEKCTLALKGRMTMVAISFVVVPIVVSAFPAIALTQSLMEDILWLDAAYHKHQIIIPPPRDDLRDIPLIGDRLFSAWQAAYTDLESTVERLAPQLLEFRASALNFVRGLVAFLITALFSLIVMGFLLVNGEGLGLTARGLSHRIAGERGNQLISLARDTTRSVAKGIVGVALLQAILGGVGCAMAGVPLAGIWTLVILVLGVAQISTIFVLGPAMFYVFQQNSLAIAVPFAIWSILVGLMDNVLKPLWMGRGVAAPMLVIFLGAIGGMIGTGLLGLFVGPVILVVTYTLVQAWARATPEAESTAQPEATTSPQGAVELPPPSES